MKCIGWLPCVLVCCLGLPLAACGNDDDKSGFCGDGEKGLTEDCDDADLGGATCDSIGMTGSGLACHSDCTFDVSGCVGCGNGAMEMGEACDGADFGTQTCANLGFEGGDLACSTTCGLDLTGCTGGCGNGVVEAGEDCDPPDGTTCNDQCRFVGTAECGEADSYDSECETATTGQWCWDGGDGRALFCGCDPEFGDTDCQVAGYERCNPDTLRCEPPPDCGNDDNEENDTPATATSLTSGTAATGVTCGYDPDWFTITPGDTALEILLTWNDDGATDMDIYVTDCNETTLAGGESGDSAQELLFARDLTPGTPLCILVNHYSGPADGIDVSYTLLATDGHSCVLDSQCDSGQVCPFVGSGAGVCQADAPTPAGCGDEVAGDNDTSSLAESLTSGTPITEGTCDGHPTGPVDVDWFELTLAAGERMTLTVDQAGSLDAGDVDVLFYDSAGEVWAVAATQSNPESLSAAGLPAGTYYVVVYYYDNDSSTAGSDTYTISLTLSSGSGCVDRDDCGNLYQRGECDSGLCVPFEGGESQGPGDFCDSSDDCSETTGSVYLGSRCFLADPDLGSDNVCVIDCSQESDCTTYGMHCYIVDSSNDPPGICLAPCSSDAGCGGGTCDTGTGICE